jgi:hypothetical protein
MVKSWWGDQTQQGGGEDPESYSHPNRGRPGSQWDWAGGKTGALFNEDRTGLSQGFIEHMQPVLDSEGTNVDLADVNVHWGASSNHTYGYDVYLTGNGNGPNAFNSDLADTLHEVGHVVQFENASSWAAVNQRIGLEKAQAGAWYGDKMMRYYQQPDLRAMDLDTLAGSMRLLSPAYTLESQADRFSDLLYSSSSAWGR